MNFQDEFYYRVTASLSNKHEIVKEKEAVLVYVVYEECVEFIVYNYQRLSEDELGNKHVIYLTNPDGSPRVQQKVRFHETQGLKYWHDKEVDSDFVFNKEKLVENNLELLIRCWDIGVKELAERKNTDVDALLESAMKTARENILLKWEDKPFPGRELTAAGFVMPTPREYAKHLQTYYKEKITKLEEELSKPRTYVHPKYFLPKLKVRAINKSKYEELPRFFYQKNIFISYVKIGKLLNYPSCCIKSFSKSAGLLSFSDAEKRRYESSTLDGTGYVPCLKCRQKEASYLLARINKKRNKKIGKLKPYFKKVKITPYTRLVAI